LIAAADPTAPWRQAQEAGLKFENKKTSDVFIDCYCMRCIVPSKRGGKTPP
jgi:hypothetical protein